MSNCLANSTSPYLLQHADNPVDWWEWGPEAFAEAKRRDTPIFLSIGYSACHWCHVMAHESFEDPATAADLNAGYVAVKVDREERPDVDAIYMQATVALTGHGGWPMTVFLDHDGRPFFAGTYYPPQPRGGLPSFRQLLAGIGEAWRDRRDDVASASVRIAEALAQQRRSSADGEPPTPADLDRAVALVAQDADLVRGGFGGAPKFPPSMLLEFLLRHAALTGDDAALRLAEPTLVAMARGGMYDQLAGGFARYSVDADWVVPHFEKMLYDNALLLRVYAHWWRATGNPLAERVVRGTAGFLLRELRTPEGGFAAALDADSEGREGAFYAWSPADLVAALGPDDGRWAADLLAVSEVGTFEHGTSTLQLRHDPDDAGRWESVRSRLLAARAARPRPARDDKVVAAWNGLAIAALAEAGALLEEPEWVEAAAGAADLILAVHLGADGTDQLARTSRDGRPGSSPGVLADYGDVAEGLQALYQATGDDEWLAFAGIVLDVAIGHFADGDGGFFDTADDAPALIHRPGDVTDDAEPSGWAAVAISSQPMTTLVPEAKEAIQPIQDLPAVSIHEVTPGVFIAIVAGIVIGRLFVIGHDACHMSLTPNRRLNKWLGRIAFLPSLTPYSLWDVGHNVVHHGYTSLKGVDFVWEPLTPAEYAALPMGQKLLQRIYRSGWAPGLYYMIEIWWKREFFPSEKYMPTRRSIFIKDSLLSLAFALVWIGSLVGLALYTQQSIALLLLFGFAIPFFIYSTTIFLISLVT